MKQPWWQEQQVANASECTISIWTRPRISRSSSGATTFGCWVKVRSSCRLSLCRHWYLTSSFLVWSWGRSMQVWMLALSWYHDFCFRLSSYLCLSLPSIQVGIIWPLLVYPWSGKILIIWRFCLLSSENTFVSNFGIYLLFSRFYQWFSFWWPVLSSMFIWWLFWLCCWFGLLPV